MGALCARGGVGAQERRARGTRCGTLAFADVKCRDYDWPWELARVGLHRSGSSSGIVLRLLDLDWLFGVSKVSNQILLV